MARQTSAVQQFVRFVKAELHESGFRLFFGRGKSVNGGGWRASGVFDDRNKFIRVARKNRAWLGVLLHEYAHFLQWKEQPAHIYNADASAAALVARYLHDGKPVAPGLLHKAFARVMTFERDADIRAMAIAKQWNLPIDFAAYKQESNLYIYAHHLMRDTGRWEPKRNCYNSYKVIRQMPKDFKAKPHQTIPNKVYQTLHEYFQ